jgi:hypothetical protein
LKAKSPLTSKKFDYRGVKYFFELKDEMSDLSVDIFYECENHQPRRFLGVCDELDLRRDQIPAEYSTSNYIQDGSVSSKPPQTVDDFLIECHRNAIKHIDRLIEFEAKINMDFHVLAARLDIK